MTAGVRNRRAGIYVRISDDKVGDSKGVARQEQDCRRLVEQAGWEVGEVYVENDTSAFKRRKVQLPDGSTALRVVRPAFRAMLEDLQSGFISALVVYDIDRMCRDPRDLEDVIDVIESTQAETRAVTGTLNLSSSDGRTMARVMTAFAQKSSEDTRRRVQRKQEEMAAAGKISGGGARPFGYCEDRRTADPVESKLVKEMFRRATKGESVTGIAKWLTANQVPTVRGGAIWNPRSVHSILTSPRVTGLRVFRGEIAGRGEWDVIVKRAQWDKVQVKLAANQNGGRERTSLRYFLSGTLWCAHCGNRLSTSGGTLRTYWCSTLRLAKNYNGWERTGGCGKIRITGQKVEEYVERVLITYLERPDVIKSLQSATSSKAISRARAEAAQDQAQLLELSGLWSTRQISTPEYLSARQEIEGRLAQWDTLQQAALPASVRRIVQGDPASIWESLASDVAARREIVRAIWPSGILIMPFVGKRVVFSPDRIVFLDWAHPEHQGPPPLTFPVHPSTPWTQRDALPPREEANQGDGRQAARGARRAQPPVLAAEDGARPARGRAAREGSTTAARGAGKGRRPAAGAGSATNNEVKAAAGRSS